MKVCKVVINSVSSDARVLKEAEAIREAGYEVVIIGIQDALINSPIEILENGIVIRRAAWQAAAFRPSTWIFLLKLVTLLSVATSTWFSVNWLIDNYSLLFPWITLNNTLISSCILVILYWGWKVWFDYQNRRKNFFKLNKREHDGVLKYQADFFAYRRLLKSLDNKEVINSTEQFSDPTKSSLSKKIRSWLLCQTPRPIMGDLWQAFKPVNLKRWKVVFAREEQIYKLLEEESPNIVHAHDLSALPLAAKYAKSFGVKLVFDAHEIYDHLAQSEDEMSELNGKLLEKYSEKVDTFITINESIARYYLNAYPKLPKALIIKNATKRIENFKYDGRLHDAAGLPRKTRILIYQGGFASKRGLIQLILSTEFLDPNWSLVLMGWGRLEEEMRRVVDALKMKNSELDQRIRFVAKVKQTELPLWTAGASLGVIPYENSGLNHWYCNPNKLWEYPNAGVPIIASPFPELRKVIEDNQIGWFLPDPLTPNDIAAAINKITSKELDIASKNCEKFIKKDNWDIYAKRLKKAYMEMV